MKYNLNTFPIQSWREADWWAVADWIQGIKAELRMRIKVIEENQPIPELRDCYDETYLRVYKEFLGEK